MGAQFSVRNVFPFEVWAESASSFPAEQQSLRSEVFIRCHFAASAARLTITHNQWDDDQHPHGSDAHRTTREGVSKGSAFVSCVVIVLLSRHVTSLLHQADDTPPVEVKERRLKSSFWRERGSMNDEPGVPPQFPITNCFQN